MSCRRLWRDYLKMSKKTCATCDGPLPVTGRLGTVRRREFCSDACQRRHSTHIAGSDPYRGVPFRCDKEKAIMSRIMVYDEDTFAVIGYLKPRFMLKD